MRAYRIRVYGKPRKNIDAHQFEYPGRHTPLITEDLFERAQKALDTHSGTGTRLRSHPHYLKGTVWCDRCKRRFVVQRAKGRHGGEYYYFFCTGRRDHICDHPYVPVEVMEQAVINHYTRIGLPESKYSVIPWGGWFRPVV